jgi:predicted phage terminase large subunit-like protein
MSFDPNDPEFSDLDAPRSSLVSYCVAQYPSFVFPKHILLIAHYLEKVERGEINRLMIFAPPRHGKSELTSKLFPAWFIGRNPSKQVAIATYGQDLSNEIGLSINQRMNSEIYHEIFPDARPINDSNSIKKTVTTKGGGFYVVGVGGALTGRGAHLRILDDPNKNREEADSEDIQRKQWTWWTSVFMTRGEQDITDEVNETSDEDKSPVVVILTRWSDKDIARRLMDKEKEDGESATKWTVLNLEAICESEDDPLGRPVVPDPEDVTTWTNEHALWPQKFSAKKLANLKRDIGDQDWNALFQQRPSSAKGDLFLRDAWRYYDELPVDCDRPIQSWDMSYKDKKHSDFVVGLTMAKRGPDVYIMDRVKGRMNFPKAQLAVATNKVRWPTTTAIYIEAKANGQPIIDTLSKEVSGITAVNPEELGSKDSRWQAASKYQQAGNIFLPRKADWVSSFVEELASVPNGKYDDDADAFAQGVLKLLGGRSLDGLLKLMEQQLAASGVDLNKVNSDPYSTIYGAGAK